MTQNQHAEAVEALLLAARLVGIHGRRGEVSVFDKVCDAALAPWPVDIQAALVGGIACRGVLT
jgi:hypothetical protein